MKPLKFTRCKIIIAESRACVVSQSDRPDAKFASRDYLFEEEEEEKNGQNYEAHTCIDENLIMLPMQF